MIIQLVLLWVAVLLVWRAAREDVARRQSLEAAWTHRSNLALIAHKILSDEESPKALRDFIDGLSSWCFDAHFIAYIREHGMSELARAAETVQVSQKGGARPKKRGLIGRRRKKEPIDPVADFLAQLGERHSQMLADACREFSYITLYAERLLGRGLQLAGARFALRPSEEYVDAIRRQLIEAFAQEGRPAPP